MCHTGSVRESVRERQRKLSVGYPGVTMSGGESRAVSGQRVRQLRPQTMTMTATTMTATNVFSEDGMTVNSPRVWRFLKGTPLVFHVFITVAVMV